MTVDPDTRNANDSVNNTARLSEDARGKIAELAQRQHNTTGLLMQAISFVGGQVEDGMKLLPSKHRASLDAAAARALRASYDTASKTQNGMGRYISTDRAHKALASVSGALGGLGGLPTALIELPVATTVIFRAVQQIASEYGEDPTSIETRAQCLHVFGKGGPDMSDDGIDTSFIGARIGLTGTAINKLINNIAPKFAAALGQKLAGQTIPVLGAVAGAGTNYTFVSYYTDIAHVHFALRQLAREYGTDAVSDAYSECLVALQSPLLKAAHVKDRG